MEGRLDSDRLDDYVEKNTQIDERISMEEGFLSEKDDSDLDSETVISGHKLKLRNEE